MTNSNLNSILFPVEKVKNPAITNSEYAYIIQGEIDGQIMDLNYCSNRYELVPNEMIFPKIEALLEAKGVDFTGKYSHVNHVRFYADYIIENESLSIGVGTDKVKPTLRVTHSYNGLTKYSMTFGYFRLICSNGLTIPLEGHEEKNLHIVGKHTKQIQDSLESLMNKIDTFIEMQPKIVKKLEVLTDRSIKNYGERVEAVLDATSLKPSKDQLSVILSTIEKEAKTLNTVPNDWLIYNPVNAYIFKGVDSYGNVSKAVPEKKYADDSKVLKWIMNNEPANVG
mgnify:CR=1 FL=1